MIYIFIKSPIDRGLVVAIHEKKQNQGTDVVWLGLKAIQ